MNVGCFTIRVKDSAGPCDCIKDSDDNWPIKKTQIISISTLTLLSLVNTLLSSKFWCVSTSLPSSSSLISTQFHLTVINITIFTCQSCIPWLIGPVQSHRQWWCEKQYGWQWHEWQWQFWWQQWCEWQWTWATVMRITAQSLKDCSSESFLWADYHLSLLCSRMDQRSLLPLL